VPYVDKVKSVKKTRGFPNRGERYGAKYENGVAYLLSYTVSVEKLWTQNTRSREKGGGGNEIHAPCACGINLQIIHIGLKHPTNI
jgi:hypothetical protein